MISTFESRTMISALASGTVAVLARREVVGSVKVKGDPAEVNAIHRVSPARDAEHTPGSVASVNR